MGDAVPELDVRIYDSVGFYEQREEVLAVYAEVYTGRLDGELICYGLGYPLPANTGWWRGMRGEVDGELQPFEDAPLFDAMPAH